MPHHPLTASLHPHLAMVPTYHLGKWVLKGQTCALPSHSGQQGCPDTGVTSPGGRSRVVNRILVAPASR